MGADLVPDQYEQPKGFSISLQMSSTADAERIFLALGEGAAALAFIVCPALPLHLSRSSLPAARAPTLVLLHGFGSSAIELGRPAAG